MKGVFCSSWSEKEENLFTSSISHSPLNLRLGFHIFKIGGAIIFLRSYHEKLILAAALIIWLSLITALGAKAVDLTRNNSPVQVYFSPRGGCTDAIIEEIDQAKSEFLLQAYSFTSAPIAKALLNAYKRGVKVEVVLDKSQKTERYSSATFFSNAGIPTFIHYSHAIAHNHPSRVLKPSPEDITINQLLIDAGEILGITVYGYLLDSG